MFCDLYMCWNNIELLFIYFCKGINNLTDPLDALECSTDTSSDPNNHTKRHHIKSNKARKFKFYVELNYHTKLLS